MTGLIYVTWGRNESSSMKVVFSYTIGCKEVGSILLSVSQGKMIGHGRIKHDKGRH